MRALLGLASAVIGIVAVSSDSNSRTLGIAALVCVALMVFVPSKNHD